VSDYDGEKSQYSGMVVAVSFSAGLFGIFVLGHCSGNGETMAQQ
jgi:hypothetical protein